MRGGQAVVLTVGVAVPALALVRMPAVAPMPVVLGLLPWLVGKYVLCPLRWHALSESGCSRRWHLRAHAESELLGLLTPGHVGGDVWRVRRLVGQQVPRSSAVAEVLLDRFVGAVGLAAFVAVAACTLPVGPALAAAAAAGAAALVALAVHRWRPQWLPRRALPTPRRCVRGLVLSVAYQASTVALLLGTLGATGHQLQPVQLLGAVGASQLAAAVPGPNGASPRDAALVAALVALGIPLVAAVAAVALKALVAWVPALLLGGTSLVLARRSRAVVAA